MDHTSQEWLNGVHLFIFHKKSNCFYESIRFCMILDGPCKSGVAEWCPFIWFSQKTNCLGTFLILPDSCVFTRQRLHEPYKSGVAEWCPFIYFSQNSHFFGEHVRKSVLFWKIPPPWRGGGGDGDGGRISQGVQALVPLRPGIKYPRKGKPLTPTYNLSIF